MDLYGYMDDYRDKFGEQFPLMACQCMTEDEIIAEIKKCIDNNAMYQYDTDNFY